MSVIFRTFGSKSVLLKVQGDDGQLPTNPSVTPALRNYHVQNSFAQGD